LRELYKLVVCLYISFGSLFKFRRRIVITVRKATVADLPDVQRVAKALKVSGRPWCGWHTKRAVEPAIRAGQYFIAENGEKALGVMSLIVGRAKINIATIAVRRSSCGTGVGSRLISFAVARGKKLGKRRVVVETFSFYHVRRFYLRTGFRIRRAEPYRGAIWYEFERRI
jgi:GNAT superfamily N-acetyltransferase